MRLLCEKRIAFDQLRHLISGDIGYIGKKREARSVPNHGTIPE